jgi:hypothetical protein
MKSHDFHVLIIVRDSVGTEFYVKIFDNMVNSATWKIIVYLLPLANQQHLNRPIDPNTDPLQLHCSGVAIVQDRYTVKKNQGNC